MSSITKEVPSQFAMSVRGPNQYKIFFQSMSPPKSNESPSQQYKNYSLGNGIINSDPDPEL